MRLFDTMAMKRRKKTRVKKGRRPQPLPGMPMPPPMPQKQKKFHVGADFDSKNHGFSSIFDLLDPQKCPKCCSRCPFEKRFKFRRLWGRIFPDFHGFGLPNWKPKGVPQE